MTGTGSPHHDGPISASPLPTSADERPHTPTCAPNWEESWYFDFVAADGTVAGFARLGLRAAEGRAWWWTAVTGPERTLVVVRDHDVDPPRGGSLEIRASGLWAEPVCETPLDHWSLGLEAMAVALDDPAEGYGGERGDPVPVGFDLEWEARTAPAPWPGAHRYGQACEVHGVVLVGRERLAIDGFGVREHAWGSRDWWAAEPEPPAWAAGHLDGGVSLGPGPQIEASVELDERGLVAAARLAGHRLDPVAHAPLQVPGGPGGRVARLARALCRVQADDGRRGWGWAERLQPA